MTITLPELAKKLGLTEAEMEKHILELGFEVEDKIEDDVAELIIDELSGETKKSAAEVYEEIAAEEREKEIIKSQRKQKAGKVSRKKHIQNLSSLQLFLVMLKYQKAYLLKN